MDQRPNIRAEKKEVLEENIGVNLQDLRLDSGFLDVIPKAQATKEKLDNLDYIKTENFCASESTIKKAKRYLQNRRKYSHIIYLIKYFSLEYTKNSYNSVIKDK